MCASGEERPGDPKDMLILGPGMGRSNLRNRLAVQSGDMHEGSIQAASPIRGPMKESVVVDIRGVNLRCGS